MFKILHWNCRGLLSKKLELKLLAEEHEPEIITLNETWLIHNETICINGYHTIVNNRISKNRGGGVATLIRNDVNYTNVNKYQIQKHEFITLDIHTKKINSN